MNIYTPRAARAFLLAALPLCAAAATAQAQRSSVTSFDRFGNAIIQETQADPTRSSVTSFDKEGNAIVTYTSPPLVPDKIVGGTAPNPNPGLYNRFGYSNTQPYPNGYYNPNYNYNYPQYNYGYGGPIYQPAYPVQNQAYVSGFGNGISTTIIPLTPSYAYPGAYAPPVYPVPTYGYPAAPYGYGVPNYGYPAGYPYGYGYGNGGFSQGTYSSNTAGYGINFGRGGFSASIGGSNTTSRSSTVITVR